MFAIPAIDIIDGKCVRLTKGDYNAVTVYHNDPLEVAKAFEGAGLKRLHLVDLDGAKEKHIINHKVLERICLGTSLTVDFGGGLQSEKDLRIAFDSGAKQITGGSIAVKQPDLFEDWIKTFGAERIILGADAKDRRIAIHGWQQGSEWDVVDFVKHWVAKGIKYCISTDVSKDGMLQGPSLDLYADLQAAAPGLKLIASGGVTTALDLAALHSARLYGAIVGKAYYEGIISLKELSLYHA